MRTRPLLFSAALALSACSESKDEPMVSVDCTVSVEALYTDGSAVTSALAKVDAHKSDGDGHPLAGTDLATSCFTNDKGQCDARFGYNLGGTQKQWAVVWVSVVVAGVETKERTEFTAGDAPARTRVVRLTVPKK